MQWRITFGQAPDTSFSSRSTTLKIGSAAWRTSRWEIARGDSSLRVTWATEEIDPSNARLRQRSRIKVFSGPRAGEALEEAHEMTAWTPARWQGAVGRSAFRSTRSTTEAGTIVRASRMDRSDKCSGTN
jgi:hypothetical protein